MPKTLVIHWVAIPLGLVPRGPRDALAQCVAYLRTGARCFQILADFVPLVHEVSEDGSEYKKYVPILPSSLHSSLLCSFLFSFPAATFSADPQIHRRVLQFFFCLVLRTVDTVR